MRYGALGIVEHLFGPFEKFNDHIRGNPVIGIGQKIDGIIQAIDLRMKVFNQWRKIRHMMRPQVLEDGFDIGAACLFFPR